MLFYELYKIMENKLTFVGFKAGDRPNRPLWTPPVANLPNKIHDSSCHSNVGRNETSIINSHRTDV